MEGVYLLLLGMGSVFLFLAVLVLAMAGMSRLARLLEPEQASLPASPSAPSRGGPGPDEEIVAVISAAISRYRHRS